VDPIWRDLKLPASHVHDEYDEQLIRNIMHYSKLQASGTLLILDDMITSEVAFNNKKGNLLKTLFYQGRHFKVSLILVSQKLKEVPPGLRLNASHIICFNLKNKKEEHDFFEENRSIEAIEAKYELATKERFNFLYIDKMAGLAYHNFEQLL
jgi:hypothetical protein